MNAVETLDKKIDAILLGGSGPALSVARTLGRAGVRVTVLGNGDAAVARSRACAEYVDFGVNDDVQGRWRNWLTSRTEGAVILPCGDDGVELIARHRQTLLECGHRPIEARDDIALAMIDKDRTYDLARKSVFEKIN
jgi:hypothetical protein